MSALDNKWLIVNKGVILTPVIDPVIVKTDKIFEEFGLKAFVTSGKRDAEEQIRIIRGFLKAKGLDKVYPDAMYCKVTDKSGNYYVWQQAWSNLLKIGLIINPPLQAECLMDYWRNGNNKKGQIIPQTPHVTGRCFDVGGAGGKDATIKDELPVLQQALAAKIGIINILPEHGNNCVHCDC